jgi:hypothetical protein
MTESSDSASVASLKDPPAPIVGSISERVRPDDHAAGQKVQALPPGHREFLWQTHRYTNEYIRFSDAKSGIAIAFSLAALGALYETGSFEALVAAPIRQWTTYDQWVAAATVLLVFAGLSAGWSIRPRLSNKQPRGFIFWESVRAHESETEYHAALARQTEADLDRHLAAHQYTLSSVTSRKFYWSAWSVLLTLAGMLLAGVLIALS